MVWLGLGLGLGHGFSRRDQMSWRGSEQQAVNLHIKMGLEFMGYLICRDPLVYLLPICLSFIIFISCSKHFSLNLV